MTCQSQYCFEFEVTKIRVSTDGQNNENLDILCELIVSDIVHESAQSLRQYMLVYPYYPDLLGDSVSSIA